MVGIFWTIFVTLFGINYQLAVQARKAVFQHFSISIIFSLVWYIRRVLIEKKTEIAWLTYLHGYTDGY